MTHSHRYYLSPVYGDGRREPYHTKIVKYPVACASTITLKPNGELMDEVALCLVSAADSDHASLMADRDLEPCRDQFDAIGKAIDFGKRLREAKGAIASMKLISTADLRLEIERRAEKEHKNVGRLRN